VKRKRDYKGEKDRNQNRKRKAQEGGVKRGWRERKRKSAFSIPESRFVPNPTSPNMLL
jgi:hypothetical protein